MFKIIDTHAHLDEFDNLEEVIDRARGKGLEAIIAVGTGYESNLKILEIGQKYPGFIYPALGLHPWELHKAGQIDNVVKLISDNINNIVAIGEIGLDYDKRVVKLTAKQQQKEYLKLMLDLAVEHNKPVSVHSRYAWKDCFDIVQNSGIKMAVFHWFTGFSSVLKDILFAGYYISATPAAEYHEEHRRAIRETPLAKLLLETDSPVTYGREIRYRAEPADVLRSLKATAQIKETGKEDIMQHTTDNAHNLFQMH